MKRFLVLCGLLTIFGWSLIAQETVTIGVFVHAPYVVTGSDNKDVQGAGIEYITAIVKEMNMVPKFVILPFPRLISGLQDGSIDMTFDLSKTAEREAFAYYSDKPAMKVSPAFFLLADSKINTITSINDLKGLTVGAVKGVVIPKFLDVPNIFKFDFANGDDGIKQNLNKLLAKRFDLAFDHNPYSFIVEANKQGVKDKIKVIPMPGEPANFYILFSKKAKNASSLLAKFNQIAASSKIDYAKIIEKSLK